MKLWLAGVSHRTAPVEVRERLAFPEGRLNAALQYLAAQHGINEAVILSTCNRVEISLTAEDNVDALEAVRSFISATHHIDCAALGKQFYTYEGKEAIRHMFRVAASLDSMILGEPQILGQMKQAYAAARGEGVVGGLLDNVLTNAFKTAKRVRSETGIGQMAVSVSYAAVELARKIFGNLSTKSTMIIGSGKMSELAVRHLRRSGLAHIFVTNRTHQRAVELAQAFNGTAVDYTRFVSMLPEIDIVIASTGATNYILTKEDMQRVISARKNRPMFLIDIAVPRNIDPAVNDIENLFLYDIDDLQGVVNSNLKERNKEAERAEAIVTAEVERMIARLHVQEVAPTIVSLQEQLEEIRANEVSKTLRKLGHLSQSDRESIEAMTRAIMNKVAHGPISALRLHAGHPEGAQVISAIRRVFHIDE
jgi:glutamyl-tRNA reductase